MFSKRQQQIIETSVKIIDEKGIQGFTIKNLSTEIGISESAIYRHFESKVMILSAVLESFKQKVEEYYRTLKETNDIPAEKQIHSFFSMMFKHLTNNPALISVIFAEEIFQNELQLSNKVLEIQAVNEKIIKEMIKDLTLNAKLSNGDSEEVTIILSGSVRLLVSKWKKSNNAFDLIEAGEKLINTILKLIR